MRDSKTLLMLNRKRSPLRSVVTGPNFLFVVVFGALLILLIIAFIHHSRISKVASSPLKVPQEQLPISQQQEPLSPVQESEKSYDTGNYSQQQGIDYHRSEITKSKPTEVIVSYYTKPTGVNLKFISALINDIPTEMIFDTGASFITVNNQTMNQLRVTTPLIKTVADTAAGPTVSFLFTASSIKIGTIELRNVQCAYTPASSMNNLLGGSFLSNFHYSINELNHTITFIPNNENVQITDNTLEPVSGAGYAEINGKKFIYREGHFAAR